MTYTPITPSTVINGDQFPAATYNTIVADIADHESRISSIVTSNAVVSGQTTITTGSYIDITFPTGWNRYQFYLDHREAGAGVVAYPTFQFLNGSSPLTTYNYTTNQNSAVIADRTQATLGARSYVGGADLTYPIRCFVDIEISNNSKVYPFWASSEYRMNANGSSVGTYSSYGHYEGTSQTITGIRLKFAGTYNLEVMYSVRGLA